jgi:capsular polysaccharide biosynthesis protein
VVVDATATERSDTRGVSQDGRAQLLEYRTASEEPAAGSLLSRSLARSLIRNWWVVVIALVVGAALGVVQVRRAPPTFDAESVVVASSTSISGTDFGSLARAVFATDTVIRPVIQQLKLRQTPQSLLSHKWLEVQAVPGAVAIRIIGRGGDAQSASALSNAAAKSFVAAATQKGMGTFAVFGSGLPGTRQRTALTPAGIRGGAVGALVGLALVLAWLLLRRPVMSEEEAQREILPTRSFLGRVRPASPLRPWRRTRPSVHPRGLAPAIWREVVGALGEGDLSRCCVVMVERRSGDRAVLGVMEEMMDSYSTSWDGRGPTPPFTSGRITDGGFTAALQSAPVVVALVAEGAPRRALRDLDEELKLAVHAPSRILVYIRGAAV